MKLCRWLLFTLLFSGVSFAQSVDTLAQSLALQMGVPEKYRQAELTKSVTLPLLPDSTLVFNRYNGIAFDDYGTSLPFAMFISPVSDADTVSFYDQQLSQFHKVTHSDSVIYFAEKTRPGDIHPVDNINKVWVEVQPYTIEGVTVTLVKMNYRSPAS
ncbi:hypothetical protein [Atlantibacter hermannii]|uniref:hypothetical protein n=1 Tax=Atlantibacter hermannii TaxID=565 RepID=UPI0028AB5783|nr:hypothetical protein [Atlantibacter hermannii]